MSAPVRLHTRTPLLAAEEPVRLGLIGDGGVSRSVRDTLEAQCPGRFRVCGVLTRQAPDVDALLETGAQIVAECAGHEAVHAHGEAVLRAGRILVVISTGALADEGLRLRLEAAAQAGGGRMVLASGAMAAVDALAAARLGGLDEVVYTGRKPPVAWRGTPAEDAFDLQNLNEARVIYRGNARDAARLYPKNANVAATVALAGLGFERTEVELVADPSVPGNVHELRFRGADGAFHVTIAGAPSGANPKTSALTGHSIVRVLRNLTGPVVI